MLKKKTCHQVKRVQMDRQTATQNKEKVVKVIATDINTFIYVYIATHTDIHTYILYLYSKL